MTSVKAQNLTLKFLNARVDALSKQFGDGISVLRAEFSNLKQTPITITGDCDNNLEFLNKLNSFQETITSSLQELKKETCDVRLELSKVRKDITKMELQKNVNTLIIHGLKEEEHENINETVVSFFQQKLKLQINKNQINFCYRLGKKEAKHKSAKSRPISVRFVSRWVRNLVFTNKKLLKGTKMLITELLTVENLNLYKKACDIYDKNNVWTYNGLVYTKNASGARELIRDEQSLGISIVPPNVSVDSVGNVEYDDS